jgi:hypothetical protein
MDTVTPQAALGSGPFDACQPPLPDLAETAAAEAAASIRPASEAVSTGLYAAMSAPSEANAATVLETGHAQPPSPPPPQVVVSRPPGMPQPVDTSTTAVSLTWAPVVCSIQSPVPIAVEYVVQYDLQMQQVRSPECSVLLASPTVFAAWPSRYEFLLLLLQVDDKAGLHPDRWSVQFSGTASFVQIKGLRPGRTYAARVVATPYVTNLQDCVVVASPHSESVLVQTLPCPPMGQPAPQLASRLKKELKVRRCQG